MLRFTLGPLYRDPWLSVRYFRNQLSVLNKAGLDRLVGEGCWAPAWMWWKIYAFDALSCR